MQKKKKEKEINRKQLLTAKIIQARRQKPNKKSSGLTVTPRTCWLTCRRLTEAPCAMERRDVLPYVSSFNTKKKAFTLAHVLKIP